MHEKITSSPLRVVSDETMIEIINNRIIELPEVQKIVGEDGGELREHIAKDFVCAGVRHVKTGVVDVRVRNMQVCHHLRSISKLIGGARSKPGCS